MSDVPEARGKGMCLAWGSNMHFLPFKGLGIHLPEPVLSSSSGAVSHTKDPSAGLQGGSHTLRLSERDCELRGSPAN